MLTSNILSHFNAIFPKSRWVPFLIFYPPLSPPQKHSKCQCPKQRLSRKQLTPKLSSLTFPQTLSDLPPDFLINQPRIFFTARTNQCPSPQDCSQTSDSCSRVVRAEKTTRLKGAERKSYKKVRSHRTVALAKHKLISFIP